MTPRAGALGTVVAVLAGCGGSRATPAPAAVVANTASPFDAAPAVPPDPDPEPADPAIVALAANAPVGVRMPALPPPECSAAAATRVDSIDINGDSKPDSNRYYVRVGGAEVLRCKLMDFDHDARWDWAVITDDHDRRVLEIIDMDYNGVADVVVRYDPATGTAVQQISDHDFDGYSD